MVGTDGVVRGSELGAARFAKGQRGAKRQPGGIATGSGGTPGMAIGSAMPIDPRQRVAQSERVGMEQGSR